MAVLQSVVLTTVRRDMLPGYFKYQVHIDFAVTN